MASNTSRNFYAPRELSGEVVSSVLELAEVKVDPGICEKWTELELLVAYDWAWRIHLRASDHPIRFREKPWFIEVAQASSRTDVDVVFKPHGVQLRYSPGATYPTVLGPAAIGGTRTELYFDEAVIRELRIRSIAMANFPSRCPAGETVVAQAFRDGEIASSLYLTKDGQLCRHNFIPPERTWVGEWQPA